MATQNMQSPGSEKAQPSLQERLLEKSVKTIEKHVEEQTSQRLQSGQNPNEIVGQLMQAINQQSSQIPTSQDLMTMAQQQVPIPGTMKGPFSALGDLVQGRGYNPMAPWTKPLGFETARQIAEYDINRQKATLDLPKTAIEILSQMTNYQQGQQKFPYEMANLQQGLRQGEFNLRKGQRDLRNAETELQLKEQQLAEGSPDAKANMAMRTKAASDFADQAPKAVFVANTLNQLAPVMESLGSFESGLLNQFGGRTYAFTQTLAKNPDFIKFDRLVNKMLPALARLGGDTGVLSDPDIARWQKVLGDKNAPVNSKIEALNELMSDLKDQMITRSEMSGLKMPDSVKKSIMEFKPIKIEGPKSGKKESSNISVDAIKAELARRKKGE